ncbi:hypothetical protein, partial [Anaerotignum sp.]|uniref:hypothetical protein n=1 Tax=Anaerotignum sp. TaxID=2039241 RepID=UPI003A854BBA
PSARIVSTTSCLNSDVYRLFATPFGIKNHPTCFQYIILSNKWGAVQYIKDFSFFVSQSFDWICFLLKTAIAVPSKKSRKRKNNVEAT